MNGYNFTERVRMVLALAREEAWRLGHDHVASEHMMLGLLREGEGVAAALLQNLGADLDEITSALQVRMLARPGTSQQADLPYTSQAKKVLELSMTEARELKHSYVGTEHLLLGFLRAGNETARDVFEKGFGISLERARAETLRLLGTSLTDTEAAGVSALRERGGPVLFGFTDPSALEIDIRVQYPDGRVVEHRCKGRFEALRAIASL